MRSPAEAWKELGVRDRTEPEAAPEQGLEFSLPSFQAPLPHFPVSSLMLEAS